MTRTRPPPEQPDAERAEIDDLRRRIRLLTEEAAANEQKLKRHQERELALMRAANLAEFLRVATADLASSFAVDAVSLAIEDPNHEIRHLLIGGGDHPGDFPGVVFVDTLVALAPQLANLHRPWLGAYVRPDHELLFHGSRDLASIALVPLTRERRTFGVLAFASRDGERFTHRHASDFLQHLGAVVAVCLDSACNRARVLRSGLADYLTGWHTRRYLHARLREELARAQRDGTSVACLMLDVDWFKAINDAHGHLGGDEVLREVTARIEAQVRASDTAARFGGDEFALLLPGTTLAEAVALAERIRAVMAPPVELASGRQERVTLSIGATALSPRRADADLKAYADRLLADADAALYRAKTAGRDRVAYPQEPG